ncbi:MAG: WG repeat-containing protein [Acidobacteria bacterium]|nr:WG repeat-containing protein [Acidobacteriota bacterium]
MFRPGDTIGAYTLIEKLGSGGFGAVWLAEKRSHFVTKKVAVKLPHDEQVNFDAIRQEATLWEQASGHPNVLPIIDADIYDGQVVIVSEYADGGSLADQLKEVGTTSVKYAVELTIGILNGLEFLHGRGIIHRDIKPANILLQGNTPRLADFGISRAIQTTAISSTVIGTDAYMAPEAFDGKRNIQTDIWSVGVVLYQLLKGSLPFPQEHPSERMFAVLTKDFDPLDAEVPQELKEIVTKALQKLPENRYATTGEMRDDLQKAFVRIAHPGMLKTEVFRVEQEAVPIIPPPPTEEVRTLAASSEGTAVMNRDVAVTNDEDEKATVVRSTPLADLAKPDGSEPPAVTGRSSTLIEYVKREPLMGAVGGVLLLIVVIFIAAMLNANNRPTTFAGKRFLVAFDGENGKKGYKELHDGTIVVPAKYDDVNSFDEDAGVGSVKLNEKWGLVDINGNEVVPPKYDNEPSFSTDAEGISNAVKLDNKFGFIDKSGRTVIPFDYEAGSWFSQGLVAVKKGGKFGYIDKTGKVIIPFQYYLADRFGKNGVAIVALGDSYGGTPNTTIIDKTGKELTQKRYNAIYSIGADDDRLEVVLYDEHFHGWHGFIDSHGNEVIPARYDSVEYFKNGKAKVKKDGREFYIDRDGNETTAPSDANN